MSLLISYSLFGTKKCYVEGAYENIKIAPKIFPRAELRFYVDEDVLFEPKEDYVQVIRRPKTIGIQAMFYRFEAASEIEYDAILFRDTDSLINPREAACIRDWMNKKETVCVINDHEHHRTSYYPLWGGMTGVKRGAIPTIKHLVDTANPKYFTIKSGDMHWMREVLYPLIGFEKNIVRYCNPKHPSQLPWTPIPPHEPYDGFVGEQIYREEK